MTPDASASNAAAARLAPRVWRPADLPEYDGPLLLDTHVWIWHLEGSAA